MPYCAFAGRGHMEKGYGILRGVLDVSFFYYGPVDNVPQAVYVFGSTVGVVDVVGMFPYIERKQGGQPP